MQINDENYEDFLLSYLDGELEEPELSATKMFLRARPERRQELETLRMTILPQEEVRFPGRQSLYRRRKLRWILLAPAAAAVALLILFLLPPRSPSLRQTGPVAAKARASAPGHPSVLPSGAEPAKPAAPAAPLAEASHSQEQKAVSGRALPALAAAAPVLRPQRQSEGPSSHLSESQAADNEAVPVKLSPLKQSLEVHIPAGTPVAINAPVSPAIDAPQARPAEQPTGKTALASIGDARQAMDQTLTGKITEIQYKVSHPFDLLRGTEIRIGRVSLAFNR